MAKNDSTKGQGAKDGEVRKGATSRTSSTGAGGGRTPTAETGAGAPAKKSAARSAGGAAKKTSTAKKAAAKTAGAGAAGDTSTGAATAKKTAAKKATSRAARTAPAEGGGGGGLRDDLRAFARAHPHGWGHDQWLTLVDDLRGKGYDVSDSDAVGMQLERERLAVALEREGVKEKAADALVDRFETVWSLRQASVDDVASVKGVTRAQAGQLKERFG